MNINTAKSALYIVAQDCEVYMDDLMVTAGTYNDYVGDDNGNGNDDGNGNENENPGNNNNDNTNTETNAPETKAPETNAPTATTEKSGCKSAVALGSVAMIMTVGAACMVIDRKKRSVK